MSSLPEWTHIKTVLLKKMLEASHITGEEARIIIAYFVAGGNVPTISYLINDENEQYISEKITSLKDRGYI